MITQRLKLIVFFCCIFAISHAAFGRLGETEAQCENRYGIAKKDQTNQTFPLVIGAQHRTYHYQGWIIRVAFIGGVAAREEYHKIPRSGISLQIKDFELTAILRAEQGTGTWKKRSRETSLNPFTNLKKTFANLSTGKVWIRTDGALAFLRPGDLIVRLELPAAAQADARAKQQQIQKQRAAVPKF